MPEFSVASFNLHWGVDTRGHPYDALGACLALNADVLVLAEAWRPHGRLGLIDELTQRTGAHAHYTPFMSDDSKARPRHLITAPGPAGTCGLAMLSRLPVRSFTALALPAARGDAVAQRHAIVAEIEVGGRPIAIGGIHASHHPSGLLSQLRALDRALVSRSVPSVIAGDCNMWGPPIGLALRTRRRAVRGRTWPSWRPHSQIDHIWVADQFLVIAAEVGQHVGSDHRSVRAMLQVV